MNLISPHISKHNQGLHVFLVKVEVFQNYIQPGSYNEAPVLLWLKFTQVYIQARCSKFKTSKETNLV